MAQMVKTNSDLISNLSVHDGELPIEFVYNGKVLSLCDVGICTVIKDGESVKTIITLTSI